MGTPTCILVYMTQTTYNKTNTQIFVTIRDNGTFTLIGENNNKVRDEELWDMAEGVIPAGWEIAQHTI
jgi:hypothetical protein